MGSTVFTFSLVYEKSKKKISYIKNLLCLWNVLCLKCPSMKCLSMKCPIYEMFYLWNVLSMKCPICEMSYLWNILFRKCTIYEMSFYEMSYLWNVLSMKFLSIKCTNALLIFFWSYSCLAHNYFSGYYFFTLKAALVRG